MGLTSGSTGINAVDCGLNIKKTTEKDLVIALAGNPNVGKSTVFNGLTGMHQHTGNWPGKTVATACGTCKTAKGSIILVDIPGTYSLFAHSAEEEVARDFICFGDADGVIVVCDATCLERNLNLVLQTIEVTDNVIICVNLLDEAKKKNIEINLEALSDTLGVPAIGTSAANGKGFGELLLATDNIKALRSPYKIQYPAQIEAALDILVPEITGLVRDRQLSSRWIALKLLCGDESLLKKIDEYLGFNLKSAVKASLEKAKELLNPETNLMDLTASVIVKKAEKIARAVTAYNSDSYNERDKKIDEIITGKVLGYPLMILLLALILWITISGANYPSAMLSRFFDFLGNQMTVFFNFIKIPPLITDILLNGVYKVLTWIIAVMLPPMAIFFPLFTFLEDLGYLPRVAFNLDKPLKKCCACGKQSLTMCMGFGCNAAGIVGCRIIDSPRERLIAILTNCFVPCNGRFPTLITLIGLFFIGSGGSFKGSLYSALILTALIIFGIIMTFFISWVLSKTILKGVPSSFTLELPPYRRPAVGQIIIRSIFDRTVFVLGRAVAIAAPAGLLLWIMANITIGNYSLLAWCSNFLDPFGRLIGLDGVILIAFILGIPANEIVLPVIIMAYTAAGTLTDISDIGNLKALLVSQGWDYITALCVMLFSLMHWPCATTLATIKKETGSKLYTAAAFFIPTICGIIICFLVSNILRLFVV